MTAHVEQDVITSKQATTYLKLVTELMEWGLKDTMPLIIT